jgi:egghead protein (zeste-white 4 protein)
MEKIKEREGIKLPYSIEIVTEEETCKKNSSCKEFREMGFNITEVPKNYSPPRAEHKARALQYAIQQTNINENHWIWHGDEETRCSESLVYGILQFILENKHVAGFGLIVYDIGWNGSVLSTTDALRTSFLFSSLGDIKLIGYPLNIFPGSNFIVRSDVEKEIGWDYRSKAEDLVFGKRIVDKYRKNSIGILPGVAHESNLSFYRDYLKQRNRWIKGAIEALKEELSIRSKLEIAYGLISWFSSLPTTISSILNIIFQSGGVFDYGGILLGITLSGLYNFFNTASKIYSSINKNHKKAFSVQKCILSILLENFAPYYSILSKLFSKLLSKSKEEGFYIVKKF